MKRILTIVFLLAGLTAAAQNSEKYELFKELRNESDTLGMKNMLDNWGDQDPEYYAAWVNYCSIMAEEAQDLTWLEMGVNWAKNGREAYPDDELLLHKLSDALFDNEQFQEALPVLQEIEERGLGELITWYHLSVIYGAKDDFAQSRKYLEKMIQEGDEDDQAYARDMLETYDQIEHQADSLALHPDHAAIKALSQTPAFQDLTARFAACDTTLTREEIATIYYGSSYLKDYNQASQQSEAIRALAEAGKIEEAKAALESRLKEYPVSLFVLLNLLNISEDEAESQAYLWKIRSLLGTIDNTGRSNSTERPFQVICVNDEYQALNYILGMQEFKSQAVVEGPQDKMDYLNDFGLEMTAYFYLTPPYWERLNSLFGGND